MRVLKIITVSLALIVLMGCSGYLFSKNMKLNKSYEAATQQITQLQAKVDAVGTFEDVWTVKAEVGQGDEIKDEDLVLQTIPTSSVPLKVITDKKAAVGKYFRIGFGPGQTITSDLVMSEEFVGAVYNRDVFLDSMPVGTKVGDYIDVRVVLPGGEEFVAFAHKRVNARYENATKLKFDESDLWIYTSMMADRALYKSIGLKIYATPYDDPGRDDKVVAYYPVRKEVIDIMNINVNLTDKQRNNMWNTNLRQSIDAKLKFYSDALNHDGPKLAVGVQDEEGRYSAAENFYQSALDAVANNSQGSKLVDPNNSEETAESDGVTSQGTLNSSNTNTSTQNAEDPSTTTTDKVNQSQDYLNNLPNNSSVSEDDSPIE